MPVARDIYPVGRLDKDSEGLLILTNDKSLNSALLSPSQKHKRSYFVQLDNDLTDKAVQEVIKGVQIKIDTGTYNTSPCSVKKLQKPPLIPERNPPVRFRQNIPTSWALIELTEGKNRQVRKMFAAVGFPVLRLVRVQIEDLKIGKLEPGKYIELKQDELFKLLKIDLDTLKTSRFKKVKDQTETEPNKTKPTAKNIKKKAIPKSGYSNAPKKQSLEKITKTVKQDKESSKTITEQKVSKKKVPTTKSAYSNAPKKQSQSRDSKSGRDDHNEKTFSSNYTSLKKSSAKDTKTRSEEKSSEYKKPSNKKPTGKAPWQKSKKKYF